MNSKKIFSFVILFFSILIISNPFIVKADIVPCQDNCGIQDFFTMLMNIYTFIIDTAAILATLAIIVGAIFMLSSVGTPERFGTGKKMIYAAIIGLVLVFGSWVIINFIMTAVGYNKGAWNVLPS